MTQKEKIEEFWNWFSDVAAQLSQEVDHPLVLQEMDTRVRILDPTVSWEIGPGVHESWQFVISPNLDRELRTKVQEIIAHAPVIEGWEFHSARKPKEWDYKLLMERSDGEPVQVDASNWQFVLLQYPDGGRELLLQANNLPSLNDDERWQAAAITLESILGEDLVLDKINDFELVDQLEPRFAAKQKPIQHLRETVLAT